MARQIVWSELAWNDLEDAADYISRDSPAYASAFTEEVLQASQSLSDFAERGQIVPELGDMTIRELLIRPYRIVYRVTSDHIAILALVHGANRPRRF